MIVASKKKLSKPASKNGAPKGATKKAVALPKKKAEPVAKAKVLPSFVSSYVPKAQGPALSPRLQAAIDKSEIAERLFLFARGLDRMDETLLRSSFQADATLDLGPGVFQGASNEYVPWVLGVLQQVRSSHHLLGNVYAQVEGDVAFVESYAQIHFRLDKPTGREDVFMGKRYLDRMERRPAGPSGVWKIIYRKEVIDWVRTEAVSEIFYHQNPDALWSNRSNTDPSYLMEQFPGSQVSSKIPSFLGRHYDSKSMKF